LHFNGFHRIFREMEDCSVRILVEGLVQGVGFRYFVYAKAVASGIRGFVRNRTDGSVEIEAEASRPILEEFITIVRQGPRSAHVRKLTVEWQEVRHRQPTFEIR
jgi:acylphosphatase